MSRLRFLFAIAALIALATAFAACGSGGNSNENPQKVVDDATLQGVESGNIDLSLDVKAKGDKGGDIDVSLSGPFQSGGEGQLPQLDLTARVSGSVSGDDIDFDGGLVLLPNRAYVNYQGTDYEVDPTTFSFVESAIKQAQQGGAESQPADATACQEAFGKLNVGDFADNLSNEGSAEVGGTSTTKVSGDLNVSGALDELLKLADDPACSAQLGAVGPLPSTAELDQAKGAVQSAIKTAHVDLYIGDDDIVRRVSAKLAIEPPKGLGDGVRRVDLEFDLTLTGVNEEQEIEAPQKAKPLNDLFLKLGVNPIELLDAFNGEGGLGGAGGLGDLLDEFGGSGGGSASGGSGGGSSSGGGSGSGGEGQQAYLNCLQGATTPVDLQKCAALLD